MFWLEKTRVFALRMVRFLLLLLGTFYFFGVGKLNKWTCLLLRLWTDKFYVVATAWRLLCPADSIGVAAPSPISWKQFRRCRRRWPWRQSRWIDKTDRCRRRRWGRLYRWRRWLVITVLCFFLVRTYSAQLKQFNHTSAVICQSTANS